MMPRHFIKTKRMKWKSGKNTEKSDFSLSMPLVEPTCPSTHSHSQPHEDSCNAQKFMGHRSGFDKADLTAVHGDSVG